MRYDGKNELHAVQARAQLEKFIKDGEIFDLTKKNPPRSIQANKYLHVILAYFASQIGETAEYVKKNYYKKLVNPQTFIYERDDRFLGRVKDLRSSADLDSAEFSLTVDRFRNWAASEAGIYLPSHEESRLVQLMGIEVERNKQYL